MATTWKKAKIGVQDIFFDDAGVFATHPTPTSSGGERTVGKINASHIPVTSTVRAKKYANGTDTPSSLNDTDVDKVLEQILDDLEDIGQPDGTILEVSSGTLQIASASITNAKMAVNSIDSDQYVDGSIDRVHLSADIIDGTKLADDSVDSEHYVAASIDNEHYADNSVGIDELNMDNSGGTFSHFVFASGQVTQSSQTTNTTITGAATSDIVIASIDTKDTGTTTDIEYARVTSTNNLQIKTQAVTSGNDAVINYVILRATTAVS